MTQGVGKRAGTRRAAPERAGNGRKLALLAVGTTLSVVAWGYLVWAAIDFGRTARSGQGMAWFYLALASVGAMACLFVGLLLVVRLLRVLGMLSPDPLVPRLPGGRRVKR